MTDTKHTPGPWRKHTPGPWRHFEGDSYVLCGFGSLTERVCENINTEANATLIAAAPDLLEALEYFARTPLDQLYSLAEGKVTNIGFFKIAQKKARIALAKAKSGAA